MKTTFLVMVFSLLAVSASAQRGEGQVLPGIEYGNSKTKDVPIVQIQKDLLDRRVEYLTPGLVRVRKQWEFSSISEFIQVSIEHQAFRGDYLEKTLAMVVEDNQTRKRYFLRVLVTYKKYGSSGWVMDKTQLLQMNNL